MKKKNNDPPKIEDSSSVPAQPPTSGNSVKPSVNFGDLVAWYRNADINQPPKVALVEKVENEVICLLVIHGGKLIEGVRHVSDPEATRVAKMATQLGGWDTLAGHHRLLAERDALRREAIDRCRQMQATDNEKLEEEYIRMDDMILDLHAKSMPILEIAKTVQRQGGFRRATVGLSRINKVIREAGASAPIG